MCTIVPNSSKVTPIHCSGSMPRLNMQSLHVQIVGQLVQRCVIWKLCDVPMVSKLWKCSTYAHVTPHRVQGDVNFIDNRGGRNLQFPT